MARDRNHYFAARDDPFGGLLRAGVPEFAGWQRALRPEDELVPQLNAAARTRLRNAADYYAWIHSRSEALADEWEEYKASRPPLGSAD
jgi:hypothetical protein